MDILSVQGFSVQEWEDDAKLKGNIEPSVYCSYRSRYEEYIRMLNGLEKSLEKHLSAGSMADLPESKRLSACTAQAGRWTAPGGSSLLNTEP